jgi:two-component system KDP operon response regulator KdpE
MNILFADIDPYTLNQLPSEINQSCPDWQISVVTSGFLCLETVRNNCPDVIILGMELSDISGLELIELIRDDSDTPIIFLSDDKEIKTLVKAFDRGATDYIVKPSSKKVFLAKCQI